MHQRLTTGNSRLDDLLGGGLLPGTLTAVLGATGIGKTQLGVSFAHAGATQEGETGVFLDLTSRGDSQKHHEYASRLMNWSLREHAAEERIRPDAVWDRNTARSDYLHLFRRSGRRVTMSDLEPEAEREWKAELTKKLETAIAFLYGNFIHGVRRCVVDGIEPVERASDSFQFEMFGYIYHQVVRKQSDWVARDLFRAQFRDNASQVERHDYNQEDIACLILCTTHEVMLDHLLTKPVESGDILSNANTVILMGKIRDGKQMRRALHVAKHRGSACDGAIVEFEVTDRGIALEDR